MKPIEPVMITIPTCTFSMGVPAPPADAKIRHPWSGPRNMQLRSFAIAQTHVTVREYIAFLNATQEPIPDHLGKPNFSSPDQPVTNTSWEDAIAYARWLADITGQPYRLPTDTEWECAARGGLARRLFPWGDEPATGRACMGRSEDDGPMPAISFAANGFSLHNMVGNVWQWCSDLYVDVATDSPVNNPTGKDPSINRVLRGGSYMTSDPIFLWCAYRHEDPPDLRHACLGFRLAKDL